MGEESPAGGYVHLSTLFGPKLLTGFPDIIILKQKLRSRHSDGLQDGEPGFKSRPPTEWVTEAISQRVKRPEREADHSSFSVVVKNGNYTYTQPCLHGVFLN
jgi:hypothetical protein